MAGIAISGSAGVGKTTLGRTVAEARGVPFIEEGMRRRIEAGLDLHTLDIDQYHDLLVELHDEMWADMVAARAERGGFVCDRSPVDVFAFWLYYGFGAREDETAALYQRVQDELSDVDLVVMLPWGTIPLEADGVRSPNPWQQLHFQCLVEGLSRQLVDAQRLVVVPDDMTALGARIDWLHTWLAEHNTA